jgi:Cdc6-like AAA superfamily ATPase
VGRGEEATELCTQLGTANHGILVLSGSPGVGKTSFFNIQQYRLENGLAPFGPKLLAARQLCPVQPKDNLRTLALRALDSLYRSVDLWCTTNSRALPTETEKIGKWLSGTGTSGFSIGISILGCGGNFGRSSQLPKAADASFESIADALAAVTSEVITILGFDSAVIALDNLENLEDEELGSMLISFRDTLFSIPNLWWVLIGQSGLGSLIQSLDPRVFERTTGSGIEIEPIELAELDEAIALRVAKFHKSSGGKSPLSSETYGRLFEASYGEMRFVFKYSNSICAKFVEKMRSNVLASYNTQGKQPPGDRKAFERALDQVIGKMMVDSQIDHRSAVAYLRDIVEAELKGLFLKSKEKSVLHGIGKAGKARASDFKNFSMRTMQEFSGNYLTKLYGQKLLTRQQEGRAVNYRLRGIAQLSYSFGLLDSGSMRED